MSPPVYPSIAQSARVSGEVEVKVSVRPDGSIESAEVIGAIPLLSEAALEAARKSEFECQRYDVPVPYSLVFAFVLDVPAPSPGEEQSAVTQVSVSLEVRLVLWWRLLLQRADTIAEMPMAVEVWFHEASMTYCRQTLQRYFAAGAFPSRGNRSSGCAAFDCTVTRAAFITIARYA